MKAMSGIGLFLGGAMFGMGALYAIEMAKNKSAIDMVEEMKCTIADMKD